VRTWRRDAGWKQDEIGCHCRPQPTSVSLGASWTIPGREDGKAVLVSAINAAYMFRGQPDYPVPGRLPVLRRLRERRWLAHLLDDARHAVQWLDDCASRTGALAELERADRNGPARGTIRIRMGGTVHSRACAMIPPHRAYYTHPYAPAWSSSDRISFAALTAGGGHA
jgi:hypothetical protein